MFSTKYEVDNTFWMAMLTKYSTEKYFTQLFTVCDRRKLQNFTLKINLRNKNLPNSAGEKTSSNQAEDPKKKWVVNIYILH